MFSGFKKELQFKNHFGLDLKPIGTEVDNDLIVKRPLGCNKIGISYLTLSKKDKKFYVIRELIPSLQSKSINKKINSLNEHSLKEFSLNNNLLYRNWIEGISIEQYLLLKEQIPINKVIEIALLVAEYIKKLHNNNIVHGSLHENNIIVSKKVQIVDNNLPSFIRDTSYRELEGQIFDSTTHIAPERLRGKTFDRSSDWYSLATIVWRMITGLPPYYCGNTVEKKIEEKPFDSKFPESLDFSWLKDLLLEMLIANPDERLTSSEIICQSLNIKSYTNGKHTNVSKVNKYEKSKLRNNVSQVEYSNINTTVKIKTKNKLWGKASVYIIIALIIFLCIFLAIGYFQRGVEIKILQNENEEITKDRDRILSEQNNQILRERSSAIVQKNQISNKYRTKNDSIQKVIQAHIENFQDSKDEMEYIENEFEKIEHNYKQGIDLLKSENEKIREELRSKDNTINKLEKENTSIILLIDSLKKQNFNYSNKIKNLQNKVDVLIKTGQSPKKELFKITEESLEKLRSEDIPLDVLSKLKTLINKEFTNETELLNEIISLIGAKQTSEYKSNILKHATKNKSKG